jgi:hypothetical protein
LNKAGQEVHSPAKNVDGKVPAGAARNAEMAATASAKTIVELVRIMVAWRPGCSLLDHWKAICDKGLDRGGNQYRSQTGVRERYTMNRTKSVLDWSSQPAINSLFPACLLEGITPTQLGGLKLPRPVGAGSPMILKWIDGHLPISIELACALAAQCLRHAGPITCACTCPKPICQACRLRQVDS